MAKTTPTVAELETMGTTFIATDLITLKGALSAAISYDDAITALLETLPSNFPLGSRRKLAQMKSEISYTISQELPGMIAQYEPVNVPVQDTPQA